MNVQLIVDLESKYNGYLFLRYQKAFLENITLGQTIYYTKIKIDNPVIVKIKYSDEIPRYTIEER